jgi:hypothetical protein
MKSSVLNRTFKTERFIGAAAAAKNRQCALGLSAENRGGKEDTPLMSAGSSERASMSIPVVVLQFLGSECALRSVVHAKWVFTPDYRISVSA